MSKLVVLAVSFIITSVYFEHFTMLGILFFELTIQVRDNIGFLSIETSFINLEFTTRVCASSELINKLKLLSCIILG